MLDEENEVRIRQRGIDGHYVYYQTTKKRINGLIVEIELADED